MNWPTPTTTDRLGARNRTCVRGEGSHKINDGLTLTDMVWLGYPLAPPGSEAYRPWERHLEKGRFDRPKVAVPFVEWLMGLPGGWTSPQVDSVATDTERWMENQRELLAGYFSPEDSFRERGRTDTARVGTPSASESSGV